MAVLAKIIFFCALVSMVTCQQCKRYCYTRWMDRDNPSGSGDWERIIHVSKKIRCPQPVGIQCQTTSGRPYKSTGDVFAIACEPRRGLACINNWQKSGKKCDDYKLRYLCPEGSIQDTRGIVCSEFCDTAFVDRDNPSGHCDCEVVNDGQKSCPGGATPAGIRCNDKCTGRDYAEFKQNITCKPDSGGICWNKNNPKGCRDYKVQYICPKYTVPTCNNEAEQLTVQDEELIPEVENYQTGDYDPKVVSNDEEVGQESPEGKSLVEEMLMQELLHTLTQ